MSNYITNSEGTRLPIRTLQVRPIRNTRKIVTRLLDGSNTIQQVGSESIQLDITVQVYDKAPLDAVCASGETITVMHFGTSYTGVISTESIVWIPAMPGDRYYTGTFSMLVVST